MPYTSNEDLPDQIKDNLPVKGQTLFRKVFNNAWEQYKHLKENVREARCFSTAWSVIKKHFSKNESGKWTAK